MDITRGNSEALFTGFKANLQQGLGMATLQLEQFAMMVNSATAIEKYPFLLLLSTMRKWIGERQLQNLEGKVLAVENDDFEHTIPVKRNDIEDDQIGLYSPLFQKMGQDAGNLWPRLAIAAMVANGTWLDGKAFFAADRKFGANTINNYVTSALTATTYGAARVAMMSYLGHSDQPLGIVPDTLIVGPKLEATAKKILESQFVAGSIPTGESSYVSGVTDSNPYFGTAKLIVHPLLVGTYDDYWFLANTNSVAKPVVVQKRKVGALIAWDKDSDTCVKDKNENHYGLHYRGAAALTLPPLMYAGIL